MELVQKSQRYFKFKVDVGPNINMKYRGVSFDNESAWFPRKHKDHLERDNLIFKNVNECLNYLELIKMNVRKNMEPVEKINSVSSELKAVNLAEDSAEWRKIQRQMIEPDAFSQEDVKAFSMFLCNNFIDRDDERFTLQTVKDFKTSIVGKLRLHDHNTSIKTGKFYDAELMETTIEEARKLIGYNPRKDIQKQLEKVREIDGGIYWLKVKFYVMNRSELEKQRVSDIQAGIDYYTSIRFNCPVCDPYYEEGGSNVLFWEWKSSKDMRAEALEGSGVWLGSQYGIVNQKGVGGKFFSQDVLANLPPNYIKFWSGLNQIHDPSLKYFCKEIDALIEKGILFVGHNGTRKYYLERTEDDQDLEYTEKIENDGLINLSALRVKIDKIDKTAGERDYSEINKYLAQLGLIEQGNNIQPIEGVERMKIKLKSLGDVVYELTEGNEEQQKTLDNDIQAKLDSIERQGGEDTPVSKEDQENIEFAKSIKALESGVSVDEVKAALNDQKKYKSQVINNIIKLERLMKVYDNDEKVEAAKAMYEKNLVDDLLQKFNYVKNLFNNTQQGFEFDGFMLKQLPAKVDDSTNPEDEEKPEKKNYLRNQISL